ncbi:Hsp20/alpha crystallin family protein [Peptococcaceae bacterium]|nr:Hsp20/alpha crystallin family protein [Peptococcaceae bacterium]MCL0100383.1 Hsp20/alpha crystallin family protein [Peptococcaceae bacterium]
MFGLTPFRRRKSDIVIKKPSDILSDVEQLFDSFVNNPLLSTLYERQQMRADIKETDKEYIVEADLPGVKKEEIDITINNDILTISVNKNEQIEEKNENYIRQERRVGSFSRSFYIDNVDSDKVTAKFENGVLTITLPKKEPTPPAGKKIDIS